MTGAFWDDVSNDVQDPEFARAYAGEAIRIRTIDSLVNALNDAAEAEGLTRAEIARAAGMQAAAVRRLLTASTVNPTVSTLVEVAATLGFRVTLEKMTKSERLEITEPMRKAAA
ncbi:helix-turn-helix domain-containing protein [Cryobacterium fucosi]|uniref:Helix-turn-helix domain-containing protein n=1 Tax=Cryobacterium fucosi TaxID=1259157 RepID=A0A4R9AV22_9MICO|nr:XRE family transcriptional regulator [Cryobacterium fucosi]TFD70419.1 helix-turn-helix domain-containing protein [Cryobacterium fucosi]